MIISAPKPLEEIRVALEPYDAIGIIGCGGCAAVCQAGGTKQVEELAQALDDKDIIFTFQIDEPCDRRILARELRRISDRLPDINALIVLACGAGVQSVAGAVDMPCLTGLDTKFAGTVIRSGEYMEICSACGQCILNSTGGICPRTLCPKGIANGPCSEKIDECCCVDSDLECVWVSIAERMEKLGLEDLHLNFSPVEAGAASSPRRMGKSDSRSKVKLA